MKGIELPKFKKSNNQSREKGEESIKKCKKDREDQESPDEYIRIRIGWNNLECLNLGIKSKASEFIL